MATLTAKQNADNLTEAEALLQAKDGVAAGFEDNPQDAAPLPSCHFDPTKPTPFNGPHKAGPFAMLSVPEAKSGLGPARTQTIPQRQPAATPTEAPLPWRPWRAGDAPSPRFSHFVREGKPTQNH
jgi:hypothetical protein